MPIETVPIAFTAFNKQLIKCSWSQT